MYSYNLVSAQFEDSLKTLTIFDPTHFVLWHPEILNGTPWMYSFLLRALMRKGDISFIRADTTFFSFIELFSLIAISAYFPLVSRLLG